LRVEPGHLGGNPGDLERFPEHPVRHLIQLQLQHVHPDAILRPWIVSPGVNIVSTSVRSVSPTVRLYFNR